MKHAATTNPNCSRRMSKNDLHISRYRAKCFDWTQIPYYVCCWSMESLQPVRIDYSCVINIPIQSMANRNECTSKSVLMAVQCSRIIYVVAFSIFYVEKNILNNTSDRLYMCKKETYIQIINLKSSDFFHNKRKNCK